MKKMLWTCSKCGGNEYSQEGKLSHVCHAWKKTAQEERQEKKRNIEAAEIIEDNPQPEELTQKKGAKRGRKSKKTTNISA